MTETQTPTDKPNDTKEIPINSFIKIPKTNNNEDGAL
mgnify:CR=1 FL=1